MNRTAKEQEVERIKQTLTKAQLAILTDYKGLAANDFNALRKKLREKESKINVVKNRLAKIAVKGTEQEALTDHFEGTTAVTTSEGDPTGPAKVITKFAKEHEQVRIKAATMNGRLISVADIQALASLPGREELIAKLMGSMMAPIKNWVFVLAQIPRNLVGVLAAIRDQKEK